MSDPFLAASGGGTMQRELQRLMQENRELREKNARLQLQAETASTSSRGGGGGLARESAKRGRPPAHEGSVAVDNAGRRTEVEQLRERLARETKARQEAERLLGEGGGADAKTLALKRQFEAFVNATCEREQAYKLVHAGVSAELEERGQLIDRLQSQIQEMRQRHQAALERAAATAPVRAQAAVPAKDLSALEARLMALEKLVAKSEDLPEDVAPPPKRARRTKGHRTEGEEEAAVTKDADPRQADDMASLEEEPVASRAREAPAAPPPSAASLVVAHGAGALRDDAAAAVAAEQAIRKERQSLRQRKVAGLAESISVAKKGRGRPKKTSGRADDGDSSMTASSLGNGVSSLFANFSSMASRREKEVAGNAPPSAGNVLDVGDGRGTSSPSSAPVLDAVHFGADPIGEYVTLMQRTPQRPHRALLAKKLLAHVQNNPSALAQLVVSRHRASHSSHSSDGASLGERWKEVEWVLDVSDAVFPALCEALTMHLTKALGPDCTTAHLPTPAGEQQALEGLRTAATLLRLAHVHWIRKGHSADRVGLVNAFLEIVVSTMRFWRFGRPGSPMADEEPSTAAAATHQGESQIVVPGNTNAGASRTITRLALAQFNAVAVALWGGSVSWVELVRYYNAGEVDAQLRLVPASCSRDCPPSLAVYAAQALLPLCLITDAAAKQEWLGLCDRIGWSLHQIPVQPLADAAMRCAATSAEATYCLRLLTIYRGFSHLQSVMERLRAAADTTTLSPSAPSQSGVGKGVDGGPGGASDAVFARLVSFAAVDLRLRDARDEQWQRTLAFLHDYLLSSAEAEFNSAEEFVWAATDAHVLAVRAILELYSASHPHDDGADGTASSAAGAAALDDAGRAVVEDYMGAAMAWVGAQRAALAVVERSGRAPPEHPLRNTALGRTLLGALPALTLK